MSDEIELEPSVVEDWGWSGILPREKASDPKFIKHIRCEGARFHVLSWDSNGTHCSEPDCIINKR